VARAAAGGAARRVGRGPASGDDPGRRRGAARPAARAHPRPPGPRRPRRDRRGARTESAREQVAAGLDRLTPEQHATFLEVNARYRERHGFPLVICAREHDTASLLAHAAGRLDGDPAQEEERALAEIAKIARLRLEDLVSDAPAHAAHISYGKLQVPVHRVHPEHGVLAFEVDLEVLGRDFLPAYTEGDNAMVVATDTMKNVILRRAVEYDGASLEGYADFLGRAFLDAYPVMAGVRVALRELPFDALTSRLHRGRAGHHALVDLELERGEDGLEVAGHRCALAGLELLKTTGSAFTRFARDADTTLPERADRPLLVHLDVAWTYADPAEAVRAPVPPRRSARRSRRRSTASSASRSSTSCTRWARTSSRGSRRWPPSSSSREPHPRPGRRGPGRPEGLHRAVPAYGLITLLLER
jgi:hypothetical protein